MSQDLAHAAQAVPDMHHTMFTAAILILTRGSLSFLYAFLRSSGLIVAMPCVVQGDQNLFLFDKFAPSRTFAPSYTCQGLGGTNCISHKADPLQNIKNHLHKF